MQKQWLGLTDYQTATRTHEEAKAPALIASENYPVVTLGRRSYGLAEESQGDLPGKFQVLKVDRGGHATIHNPGQLVIYPKLNLPDLGLRVRSYIELLAETTVRVLSQLGLESEAILESKVKEPGIYTSNGKIGFIGVRVLQGVTYHGLSINVCNDLSDFAWIRSCSVWQQPMDSLAKQSLKQSPEQLFALWSGHFSGYFSEPISAGISQSHSLTLRPHLSKVDTSLRV